MSSVKEMFLNYKKFWFMLLLLIFLTPIGIYLPHYFNGGDAWGEWAPEDVAKEVGYMPAKMEETASLWNSPVPDYSLSHEEDEPGLLTKSIHYIFSAFLGVSLCGGVFFIGGKALKNKK